MEKVYALMEDRLSIADHDLKTNQEPRWKAVARFAVVDMKEEGYLSSDAPRGIWRLA